MNRNLFGLGLLGLLVLLQATPALADIQVQAGTNILKQGVTRTLTITGTGGSWPGNCKRVELGTANTGVTVNKAPGSTGHTLNVSVTVAEGAQLGRHTVLIRYQVELNGPERFDIIVVRNGRLTDVDYNAAPSQFFQEAELRFTGQNIGNAGVSIVSADPTGTRAEVTSSSDTAAVVKLTFPSLTAYAKVQLKLYDKNGSFSNPYQALSDNSGLTEVIIEGPNAVKSITFPITGRCGNGCFKVGDDFTIQVDLVRPAKQPPLSSHQLPFPSHRPLPPPGQLLPPGGELITWSLTEPGAFKQAEPQTPYKSDGSFNTIRVPPGDTSIRFRVQVAFCPGAGQTNAVFIKTWTGGNTNRTQGPEFQQKQFTINCQP